MLTKRRTKHSAAARGASRQDGQATRQQILEVAGEVFGRLGYAHATSKEICERARTNAAAVNYHFGSKDGLYSAVLVEAHHRLVSIEQLTQLAQSNLSARQKLGALIARLAGELTRKNKSAWESRVLSRELLSPSPMFGVMLKSEAVPKASIVRSIIAAIMDLPEDHPAVARSLINVIGPCIMLLLTQHSVKKTVLPDLDLDAESLTQHMLTYALAGLEAVAKEARARS
jgi:TetR/AcrR family transcriptional regulator, regulator of cefoperazone and chloramphenicol sensitivity